MIFSFLSPGRQGLLSIALCFTAAFSSAQSPINWSRSLGGSNYEDGYYISATDDGGSILAGKTQSLDGDVTGLHGTGSTFDVWIVKLDNAGIIQWQKTFGGTESEEAHWVQQTADGGYIVAGSTSSQDGDVSFSHGTNDPAHAVKDAWLLKLSAAGVLEWEKTFGGNRYDAFFSVDQTSDHGYFIGGQTESNNDDVSGNHDTTGLTYDAWAVKTDSAGNIQWQKTYGGTAANGEGFYGVQQAADGGYIAGGYTYSNNGDVSGNHGGIDAWILKLDTAGTIQWQKVLGGSTGGSTGELVKSIRQTADGGYIAACFAASADGDITGFHGGVYDAWALKLDAAGNLQWQHAMGGSGAENGNFIIQTTDGGYMMAVGSTSNNGDVSGAHGSLDAWLVKLNSAGAIVWQKPMGGGGYEDSKCVTQTATGDFIFLGINSGNGGDVTGWHGPGFNGDIWVVNFSVPLNVGINDPEGNVSFCSVFPSPSGDAASLSYTLENPSKATLCILDLQGKVMVSEDLGLQAKGDHLKQLDLRTLAQGMYILQLRTAAECLVSKLVRQ